MRGDEESSRAEADSDVLVVDVVGCEREDVQGSMRQLSHRDRTTPDQSFPPLTVFNLAPAVDLALHFDVRGLGGVVDREETLDEAERNQVRLAREDGALKGCVYRAIQSLCGGERVRLVPVKKSVGTHRRA